VSCLVQLFIYNGIKNANIASVSCVPYMYTALLNKCELECGPMPNVMAALPNRWRPLVQCRKVSLTPSTRMPCSNAAKTRDPLKLAGVLQTNEKISAASRLNLTILLGHVGEILLFNKFFSDCQYVP